MFNHGHPHAELLLAIDDAGGVPCQDLPEVFFPEDIPDREVREKAIETAKTLCADCPIRSLCRDYAVTTRQEYGIWGGHTVAELKAHRAHPGEQ